MKLAMITGGSRGLGKALVQSYLRQGWTVKEFSRSGLSEVHINCDFADAKQVSVVIGETFAQLSKKHWSQVILINNAATVAPMGLIETIDELDCQKSLQINLTSVITTTSLFIKYFAGVGTQASVVNISSGVAVQPFYGWSLYCATKAGLEAFSGCVALEQLQANHPVAVYVIRPGVIDTEMQQQIRAQNQMGFAEVEKFKTLKRDGLLVAADDTAAKITAIIADSPESGGVYDVNQYAGI